MEARACFSGEGSMVVSQVWRGVDGSEIGPHRGGGVQITKHCPWVGINVRIAGRAWFPPGVTCY